MTERELRILVAAIAATSECTTTIEGAFRWANDLIENEKKTTKIIAENKAIVAHIQKRKLNIEKRIEALEGWKDGHCRWHDWTQIAPRISAIEKRLGIVAEKAAADAKVSEGVSEVETSAPPLADPPHSRPHASSVFPPREPATWTFDKPAEQTEASLSAELAESSRLVRPLAEAARDWNNTDITVKEWETRHGVPADDKALNTFATPVLDFINKTPAMKAKVM